jgi:hypothetical protein
MQIEEKIYFLLAALKSLMKRAGSVSVIKCTDPRIWIRVRPKMSRIHWRKLMCVGTFINSYSHTTDVTNKSYLKIIQRYVIVFKGQYPKIFLEHFLETIFVTFGIFQCRILKILKWRF